LKIGFDCDFGSRSYERAFALFLSDLLLVILDYLGRAHFRLVRVIAEFSKCPALAQEVPVLVELDL
jgi:hypothetical protein